MSLDKGKEFINYLIEQEDNLEHGIVQKASEALKKVYGTLTSMQNAPLYFWNVPNKIKDKNGYWVLQKKEWHSDKIGVTATYKHDKTGEIATEGYELIRTKKPNSLFKYNEKEVYKTGIRR